MGSCRYPVAVFNLPILPLNVHASSRLCRVRGVFQSFHWLRDINQYCSFLAVVIFGDGRTGTCWADDQMHTRGNRTLPDGTCWAFLIGLTVGGFKRSCGCGSRLSPGRPMRVEWRLATALVKYCLDFVFFFLLMG